MNFIDLEENSQLQQVIKDSQTLRGGAVIFKHSTRCAISNMALDRFRRGWKMRGEEISIYYLDLIRYRSLSDKVSELFAVSHESPQVLLIKNGKCVYNASHNAISPATLEQEALNA